MGFLTDYVSLDESCDNYCEGFEDKLEGPHINYQDLHWHAQRAQKHGCLEGVAVPCCEHTTLTGDKAQKGRPFLCRGRVFGFTFRNHKTPHPGEEKETPYTWSEFPEGQGPV